ncbi:hypothetical protein Dimus_020567 [Dionaea muscipula]
MGFNILPRFGKRDVASFMDLTYMDYLLTRKMVNLPRKIIRHMGYVIYKPRHELPYGELLTRIFHAFDVPLDDIEAEQPVKTYKFEETSLSMCGLKRKNGIWWFGSGENRRRDEEENDEDDDQEESEQEEEDSEKTIEDVDARESTPTVVEGKQSEQRKKEAEVVDFESTEAFFDAEDGGKAIDEAVTATIAQPDVKKNGKSKARRVDLSSTIPNSDLLHLQTEMDRALKANARFQELLQ